MVVRTRLRNGSLAVLLVGAGALGCGGTTAESKPTPVARGDFVEAWCTLLSSCCPGAGIPYDDKACRRRWPFRSPLRDVLDNPKVAFDELAAGECIAAVRSARCEETDATDSVCRTVFSGTVPAEGACANEVECVRLSAGVAICNGTCHPEPRGKAGDPCSLDCFGSGSSVQCGPFSSTDLTTSAACYYDDGLWCGPSRTCEPLAAVSQSCGIPTVDGGLVYVSCVGGAYCDPTTNVCTPVLPIGSDCSNVECDATTYCDSSTRKCTALKANGATCRSERECSSAVCAAHEGPTSVIQVCARAQSSVATTASCEGFF